MAQLVRAVRAVHDLAVAYGVPLISGKDSMKNDYVHGDLRISIPPTLLFSAVGIVPDVSRAVTMDVKAPGDTVYLLGRTRDELGGSELLAELGRAGGQPPQVHPERARALYRALFKAIQAGWVRSAHDCSDGGLAVALAETAFAGGLGLSLDLSALDMAALAETEGLAPAALLFSETPSRLVVSVAPAHREEFEAALAGLPCARLGEVTDGDRLTVRGPGGAVWLDATLADLKAAWQAPLRDL
jgi:phosphoribosylformylglycinamidine synthase